MIVKITWKAFGNQVERKRFISSVTFALPIEADNEQAEYSVCNTIYSQTNQYDGTIWLKHIQPLLAPNRTHTALSVGDEIELTNEDTNMVRRYVCAPIGWRCVEEYELSTQTPHDREHGFSFAN